MTSGRPLVTLAGAGRDRVEPYFKRAEKFIGQGNDANIYGTEGKMGVEQNRFRYQADDIVLRALKERGYKLGEVNGAEEDEGFWARAVQSTTLGWRAGTYNSFVRPLLDEKDIKVLTYTLAKEVVFDEKDKLKAKGIKVERFGEGGHSLCWSNRIGADSYALWHRTQGGTGQKWHTISY